MRVEERFQRAIKKESHFKLLSPNLDYSFRRALIQSAISIGVRSGKSHKKRHSPTYKAYEANYIAWLGKKLNLSEDERKKE